jgi:hypothetical protein
MPYSDRLAYRVLITHNGTVTDYAYRTSGATITINTSAIPILKVDMAHADQHFYKNAVLDPEDDIEIQASADGGYAFVTLFRGKVSDPTYTMASSGEESITIQAEGAAAFKWLQASPNQSVIGPTDISYLYNATTGNIFQGAAVDRNGVSWSADEDGNYPNGLLYKSGYSLDPGSHWDYAGGFLDIPDKLRYNAKTIYELVKGICDIYGAMFWFDDINRRVIVRPTPVVGDKSYDFPMACKGSYRISPSMEDRGGVGRVATLRTPRLPRT